MDRLESDSFFQYQAFFSEASVTLLEPMRASKITKYNEKASIIISP